MAFLHILPRRELGGVLWRKVLDGLQREAQQRGARGEICCWLDAGFAGGAGDSGMWTGVVRHEGFSLSAACSSILQHAGAAAAPTHICVAKEAGALADFVRYWVRENCRHDEAVIGRYFDFCSDLQAAAPAYCQRLLEAQDRDELPAFVLPAAADKWLPCELSAEELRQSMEALALRVRLQERRGEDFDHDARFPAGWSLGWLKGHSDSTVSQSFCEQGLPAAWSKRVEVGGLMQRCTQSGRGGHKRRWQRVVYERPALAEALCRGEFESLKNAVVQDQLDFFDLAQQRPRLCTYVGCFLADFMIYDLLRDVVEPQAFTELHLSKCLQGYNLWGRFFQGMEEKQGSGGSVHVLLRDPGVVEVLSFV